jgi:hypothetical protein
MVQQVPLVRGRSPDPHPFFVVAFNFVRLRPSKTTVTMFLKLPRSDDIDGKINTAGLDTLEYDNRSGAYRLSLDKDDIETKKRHHRLAVAIGVLKSRSATAQLERFDVDA